MASIVDIINQDASDTLNKVIEEVDSQDHTVREIWRNDLRFEFDTDQAVNGTWCCTLLFVCVCVRVYVCVCVHLDIIFLLLLST